MSRLRFGQAVCARWRRPEDRYADARGDGEALRDGLRGVAPAPTDADAGVHDDEPRRAMLEPHRRDDARCRAPRRAPRRRLEPIAEAPPPRAARPPAPAPRRAAPAKRGSGCAASSRLVVVARCSSPPGSRSTRRRQRQHASRSSSRQDISGSVNDAVDQIKQLIEDNTQ